jgi:hypothetical protein
MIDKLKPCYCRENRKIYIDINNAIDRINKAIEADELLLLEEECEEHEIDWRIK